MLWRMKYHILLRIALFLSLLVGISRANELEFAPKEGCTYGKSSMLALEDQPMLEETSPVLYSGRLFLIFSYTDTN